jgi:hypothetical protein
MWYQKFLICLAYDLFDFTVGRLLFPVPFIGEVLGCFICMKMFGTDGVL